MKTSALLSAALLSGWAVSAQAEQVDLDLLLDPSTSSVNTIELTVEVSGFDDSDSSGVSGNALASTNIDFLADGQVDMIQDISFSGGGVVFDNDLNFNINAIVGSVLVDGTGLGGTLGTPAPPAPVVGSGSFDLAFHQMTVNQGVLTAQGTGLLSGVNQTVDFAAQPTSAALVGSASLGVTLDSVVGNTGLYTATLVAPISFTAPFEAEGITVNVSADGLLIATDTFARQLTTPGDLDGDGMVNAGDLDLLLAEWGLSGSAADADGSGTVDEDDLAIVINHWGDGDPPDVNIPEPGSLALIALGGLALFRRRR